MENLSLDTPSDPGYQIFHPKGNESGWINKSQVYDIYGHAEGRTQDVE